MRSSAATGQRVVLSLAVMTLLCACDRPGDSCLYYRAFHNMLPVWSPDGTKVAFSAEDPGGSFETNLNIMVMEKNGTGKTRRTDTPADEFVTDWSPDGTRILFRRHDDLWVLDLDDGSETNLTESPDRFEGWAGFSPDGTHIVFDANGEWLGDQDIWIMDLEDGAVSNLTPDTPESTDVMPEWSPDGKTIVFVSDRAGNDDIYTMETDGSGVTQLTDHPERDWWPTWDPTSTKIAFVSRRRGGDDIYVLNTTDPEDLTSLVRRHLYDVEPDWSPDGEWIVFTGNTSKPVLTEEYGVVELETEEIYRVSASGGGQLSILTDAPFPRAVFFPFPCES